MRLLFVCTGNTCRSPMAEALFRRLASDRLNCSEDKLLDHDLDVFSAGVAAADSAPASPEAIQILKERGIPLAQHLSQQVTDEMLVKSDLILAMTPGHLGVLRNARPDLASRMRLLQPNGSGVLDPIGGGMDDYRQCADEITTCLESLLDELIQKDTE
ncbi:MAG: hypothetical protein R3C59_26805 [Planctomycetaceae bacterium]